MSGNDRNLIIYNSFGFLQILVVAHSVVVVVGEAGPYRRFVATDDDDDAAAADCCSSVFNPDVHWTLADVVALFVALADIMAAFAVLLLVVAALPIDSNSTLLFVWLLLTMVLLVVTAMTLSFRIGAND
jgi:hypothetical protein